MGRQLAMDGLNDYNSHADDYRGLDDDRHTGGNRRDEDHRLHEEYHWYGDTRHKNDHHHHGDPCRRDEGRNLEDYRLYDDSHGRDDGRGHDKNPRHCDVDRTTSHVLVRGDDGGRDRSDQVAAPSAQNPPSPSIKRIRIEHLPRRARRTGRRWPRSLPHLSRG